MMTIKVEHPNQNCVYVHTKNLTVYIQHGINEPQVDFISICESDSKKNIFNYDKYLVTQGVHNE